MAPFLLQKIVDIVKTCAKAAIVCKNLSECAHARKPKEQESVANLTSDEEWNETLQTKVGGGGGVYLHFIPGQNVLTILTYSFSQYYCNKIQCSCNTTSLLSKAILIWPEGLVRDNTVVS